MGTSGPSKSVIFTAHYVMQNMQPLAFVDLETTGANPTTDRITEIGVVEVDGDGVRTWSQLVNPQTPIPPFIERLTGISDAMVSGAPTFAELAGQLQERLQGRLFIAHNARFDYGFLKQEFKRLGRDFRATVLCTVKLSRKLYPQHHRHSLDSLVERHGLQVEGDRHRALADARLIHQFWQRAHEELPGASIAMAVQTLTARPTLPAHLDPDLVHLLPDGAGIYLFYGENGQALFVGRSSQLKKRVLGHFTGSAGRTALAQAVRRVEWVETAGEIGAALKELQLLRTLQPAHNRPQARRDELCLWRLDERVPGHFVPELVSAQDLDMAQPHLYGPFKTPRDARRGLKGLAEEHGLCLATLGIEAVRPGQVCHAHRTGKCRGTCLGKEPVSGHSARLMAALGRVKLKGWPHAGPALLREGESVHAFAHWCHLGTARDEGELAALLAVPPAARFDADVYRLLLKVLPRLEPLT